MTPKHLSVWPGDDGHLIWVDPDHHDQHDEFIAIVDPDSLVDLMEAL